MRIDFARYLSIWMFWCRQEEKVFWKTMNPCRLHALFDAQFLPAKRTGTKQTGSRYVDFDTPAGNDRGLADYFMRGG